MSNITRSNVEDLLARGRLQFRRGPERWVDIVKQPGKYASRWEAGFYYNDGPVMGFGAITEDWFDKHGEMVSPILLREKSMWESP